MATMGGGSYPVIPNVTEEYLPTRIVIASTAEGGMNPFRAALLEAVAEGRVELSPPHDGQRSATEAIREMEQRNTIARDRQVGMTGLAQEYAAMQAAAAYAPMNRRQRRAAAKASGVKWREIQGR